MSKSNNDPSCRITVTNRNGILYFSEMVRGETPMDVERKATKRITALAAQYGDDFYIFRNFDHGKFDAAVA